MMDWLVPVVATVVTASTPLFFAALGELVTERSGVLNLGVEGMMILGAVAGFSATLNSGSYIVGFAAAAGAAAAFLFATLVIFLRASQVAAGLALTIFCLGLSALAGRSLVGKALESVPSGVPYLSDLPLVGGLLFGHDAMVYLSIAAAAGVWWFLNRSRAGLVLRSIGEDHTAAHALGYRVVAWRFGAVLFGSLMAGLGGAYLSLAYTPLWAENMTAGRGWIALALVVFASWRPFHALAGAYLFGGVSILQLHLQGLGFVVPSQYMSMLPYFATIAVLIWSSAGALRNRFNAPACLGKHFAGG